MSPWNVGYADPNYFSYVFKRKLWVSPSRYRTECRKNEGINQAIYNHNNALILTLLSFAIILVIVVVMYIKFADASSGQYHESNHKVMDQTMGSVKLSGQYRTSFGCGVL